MGTGVFNDGGNPVMDWHPIQGGVEILPVASCHGNRDNLRRDGPPGSYADLTFYSTVQCIGLVLRGQAKCDLHGDVLNYANPV